MSAYFKLTEVPVTLTFVSPVFQPDYQALDVGGFDVIDLECTVSQVSAPPFVMQIWTANPFESTPTDAGWTLAGAFANFTTPGQTQALSLSSPSSPFLKFIRWKATGSSNTVTFFICGNARRFGD